MPTLIETTTNPVREAATSNILGKNPGDSTQNAYIVAGNDMGMQLQIDPGLGLACEVDFAMLGGKSFWSRRLDRQIDIPAVMTHLVDGSHATLAQFIRY